MIKTRNLKIESPRRIDAKRRRPSDAPLERSSLRHDIRAVLKAWRGFNDFSQAFSTHPQLDIFLAGGALRNVIAGSAPSKDFDFFVDGDDIDSFLEALRANGTVTFGPFGSPRWTPRSDSSRYADIVRIRRFDNGLSACHNMRDVLHQFDFTGNAVALNLRSGVLLDPLGGTEDIRSHVMRAVRFDYPDDPISSDASITRLAVLWFRLLHYATLYNMTIEARTMSWLMANRHYGRHLAEFSTLFFRPHSRAALIHGVHSRS